MYKHVNLCKSGCPFKVTSQICPRPFDQAFCDWLALGGSRDGRVHAGWEVVDVGNCGFDPRAQTHKTYNTYILKCECRLAVAYNSGASFGH